MKTSEQIELLAAALSKSQATITAAAKDSRNPFFNSQYADLASVWDACRSPLTSNGLSVVQIPVIVFRGEPTFRTVRTQKGDERTEVQVICEVSLITRLLHVSGQWIESELMCVLPKGDPQSIGSAITYLRRYGLAPLVGVVADIDDDGNAASHPVEHEQTKTLQGPASKPAPRAAAKPADKPPATPAPMTEAQIAFNEWASPLVKSGILMREELIRRLDESKHDYTQVRADLEAALAELEPAKV